MLKVVFKNMEPSQLLKEFLQERVGAILEKYPSLRDHKMTLTAEMENSPTQPGPDLFTVSTHISGKSYRNLKIKKSAGNFYSATAEFVDRLNQVLSDETDRIYKNNRKRSQISGELL